MKQLLLLISLCLAGSALASQRQRRQDCTSGKTLSEKGCCGYYRPYAANYFITTYRYMQTDLASSGRCCSSSQIRSTSVRLYTSQSISDYSASSSVPDCYCDDTASMCHQSSTSTCPGQKTEATSTDSCCGKPNAYYYLNQYRSYGYFPSDLELNGTCCRENADVPYTTLKNESTSATIGKCYCDSAQTSCFAATAAVTTAAPATTAAPVTTAAPATTLSACAASGVKSSKSCCGYMRVSAVSGSTYTFKYYQSPLLKAGRCCSDAPQTTSLTDSSLSTATKEDDILPDCYCDNSASICHLNETEAACPGDMQESDFVTCCGQSLASVYRGNYISYNYYPSDLELNGTCCRENAFELYSNRENDTATTPGKCYCKSSQTDCILATTPAAAPSTAAPATAAPVPATTQVPPATPGQIATVNIRCSTDSMLAATNDSCCGTSTLVPNFVMAYQASPREQSGECCRVDGYSTDFLDTTTLQVPGACFCNYGTCTANTPAPPTPAPPTPAPSTTPSIKCSTAGMSLASNGSCCATGIFVPGSFLVYKVTPQEASGECCRVDGYNADIIDQSGPTTQPGDCYCQPSSACQLTTTQANPSGAASGSTAAPVVGPTAAPTTVGAGPTVAPTTVAAESTASQGPCPAGYTEPHTMCLTDRGTVIPMSQADIDAVVARHNEIRANVPQPAGNMQKMVWDEDLAKVAGKKALQCETGHDAYSERTEPNLPGVIIGQNAAYGYNNALLATEGWYNEINDFNYGTYNPNKVVGHYTQQVFPATARIGCGIANCTAFSSYRIFTYCNYAPGQTGTPQTLYSTPYTQAASCSSCPDSCDSSGKLCDCQGKVCTSGTLNVNTCTCG